MLKKKLVLLCLVLLTVSGCAGLGDYDIDLPGDYSILRTSGDQITIASKTEIGWGENIVPAKVIAVGWNEHYIIAKQKKIDENETFYWILDIKGNIDGPLDISDFQEKKREYKISDDVKMEKVGDIK